MAPLTPKLMKLEDHCHADHLFPTYVVGKGF